MKKVTLVQGSPEWHSHRANHFNASDAPAMLGISKHKSRTALIRERATGIIPDVDSATQIRFNDGHIFEALARPLAEQIIGDELSPVTGVEGKYSASLDGITFGGEIIFEHKTLNDKLRAEFNNAVFYLPEEYRAQMEHQLMVSGADKCLFMASTWDKTDEQTEHYVVLADEHVQYYKLCDEVHCWYMPDLTLRARIIAGWEQFAIDLEGYQHVELAAKPQAEVIMDLPALSVQATGMVTYSNLPEFKAAAESYIANINTKLETDQHFADAEATVKFCKATEEKLEVTKSAILAQTATIDEVIRTVDHIQAQLRDKRLMLDKLVKSEKEARKREILTKAHDTIAAHVAALEKEITPIRLFPSGQKPDFAGAIHGKKNLASMQGAVNDALANAKIAADQVAKDVRAKLTWCKDNAAGMSFLFPDLQQIISKPMDDFTLTITSRIEAAKKADAEKLEAERQRIRQEEEAKAREKVAAEKRAAEVTKHDPVAAATALVAKDMAIHGLGAAIVSADGVKHIPVQDVVQLPSRYSRPTDDEIIAALSLNFRAPEHKVIEWLLDMDLTAASERMAKEFA